jgi:hypothetical protein
MEQSIKEELFRLELRSNSHQTHFPILSDRIGYRQTAKLPIFSTPQLINNEAINVCRITLPNRGVWLIRYEVNIANIHKNDSDDGPAVISNIFTSVTLGNSVDVQFVPQLLYKFDSISKILESGDAITLSDSDIYYAEDEFTLSFNLSCEFQGRLYLSSNFSNNVCEYNLSAVRIG